jgi:predicted transcriptional regulator
MSKNQNTKLSDEHFNKLSEYATADDVSVSHIVRRAIKAYIINREGHASAEDIKELK